MATQYANGKIVTDGLVLSLDAADRNSYISGSLVWNDMSGNNNNGTLTNGPTFNSGSGGSIVFDGVDDRVTINASSGTNYGNIFTAFFWVRFNRYLTVLAGHVTFDNGGYLLYVDNSNTIYTSPQGGGIPASVSGVALSTGVWHQLVVVRNITNISWYKNGVSLGSTTTSDGVNIVSSIGSYIGGTYVLDGNIASVQIYNKALSAQEVLQNYSAQKSRFGLK